MGDRSKAPVYVVKPSVEFKQPFKFDFDKPSSKDFQNQEITDHFNYGFCQMTMNSYVKALRLGIKTLDKTMNPNYVINEHGNLRLNDEIPMDYGGFNNFYDPKLLKNSIMPNLDKNSDELVWFLMKEYASTQYPLLSFVKSMYKPEGEDYKTIEPLLTEFENNFEENYRNMMVRKDELDRLGKGAQQHKKMMREQEEERERQAKKRQQERERRERQKERGGKSSDKDDSDDSNRKDRKKDRDKSNKKSRDRDRDSRSRSRRKSKDRRKKDRDRDRKKQDKDRKRSRSRNKSSDRHKRKHKD